MDNDGDNIEVILGEVGDSSIASSMLRRVRRGLAVKDKNHDMNLGDTLAATSLAVEDEPDESNKIDEKDEERMRKRSRSEKRRMRTTQMKQCHRQWLQQLLLLGS